MDVARAATGPATRTISSGGVSRRIAAIYNILAKKKGDGQKIQWVKITVRKQINCTKHKCWIDWERKGTSAVDGEQKQWCVRGPEKGLRQEKLMRDLTGIVVKK